MKPARRITKVRSRGAVKAPREKISEETEQRILAAWLDLASVIWTHVPNEIAARPQYMVKRRALGVKAGVPDVLIFNPPPSNPSFRGVAIELKNRHGGRLTTTQRRWISALSELGWYATVCHGADEAIELLYRLGYCAT